MSSEADAPGGDNTSMEPPNIEEFTREGFKILMEAIRHSNTLPQGAEWRYHNTNPTFRKFVSEHSSTALGLINNIMKNSGIESNIKNWTLIEEKSELVIEANDTILEKVDINIDEMNGIRKSVPEPIILQTVSAEINGSWNRDNARFSVIGGSGLAQKHKQSTNKSIQLITAKNIIRPQKFFKDKPDNTNEYPWQPKIKDKPNSLKPLAIFLEEYESRQEFSHPYEYELERFTPAAEHLTFATDATFKPLDAVPLVEIVKPEQIPALLDNLRSCKEFAVDLEHHSYRSFMGITCLMQISTPDVDYLIDTLALRDHLSILNEVFTKTSIVKIFHGAEKDVEWLQRDLSIYVVNMFDTHQAAKMLEYSGLSLAYLMKRFCNVLPDKQYQLADWRIRPLPDELKKYAREDTHYLIYIYNKLKEELCQKGGGDNMTRLVFERSTEVCKRRYFKPLLLEDSHMDLYRRFKKMFDNRQMFGLREIFAWRDRIAREEDESPVYVLPNHMLLQIAETLPREMQGILACCNPIPPLIRSHLLDVHRIVLRARDQPLVKAILKEDTTGRGVLKKVTKVNVDSPLHCPHDLTKSPEFRDDLPTLLSPDKSNESVITKTPSLQIEKTSPSYPIFGNSSDTKKASKIEEVRAVSYLSPYQRYKLIRPFIMQQEAEEKSKESEGVQENKSDVLNPQEPATKSDESRTDDERIASIRDHFVEMSKKFHEESEAKRKQHEEKEAQAEKARLLTLAQMGGSRKRKRDESSDNESDGDVQQNFGRDYQLPSTSNLHTTIPNNFSNKNKSNHSPRKNSNKKGKKRKFSELNDNIMDNSNVSSTGTSDDRPGTNQYRNKNRGRGSKRFNNRNNNAQQTSFKRQQDVINKEEPQAHSPNKKNRYKGNKTQQANTEFVPYDYSCLDFRQFQGGAGRADSGTNIKPNFKAKGRNNNNRTGNRGGKSATFNPTSNSNHRGRGRGRGRGR